ncbi:Utp12-domain-containing protein [Basidiobolus meristosporus CBS 931.73]|uniref:Utp12-domain-containing protein n=1 Tax=Basidiobolus meristosporus CBS 931.73 TaxID=1314790 RepID=A0A1Y1Y5N2_9FUNG|nr:Utp12-domain-containing protein [Basidiobolus meristosporus CBS 931.73]|eukprot:ORX92914.1 Utp12-domain-containing protein [Basidiobolus meristosporus CBS 931.73]
MVKAYLRYEPQAAFGVITSSTSNAVFDAEGKFAVAPALEDVIVWDLKKGIQVSRWHDVDNKSEVSAIARSPNGTDYAVGYSDGSIRIWNLKDGTPSITFNGHKGEVSALTFDKSGTRLASGSKDTDLIIWDVVGEVGLYRLKGHKDMITSLKFMTRGGSRTNDSVNTAGYLLSSSKDTLVKLWDLATQHCVETLVAHRSEVWSFDLTEDQKMLITGGGDNELRVWRIDQDILDQGIIESSENEMKKAFSLYGPVYRQSKERVVTIQIHPSGDLMACQCADKTIEIFRIRSQEELQKKLHRRMKRQKEKMKKAGKTEDEEPEVPKIQASDEVTSYQTIRTAAKLRSIDFSPQFNLEKNKAVHILGSLTNNVLEMYSITLPSKSKTETPTEPSTVYTVDLQGHRSDVRTLALSSDDELLCSASSNLLKIWNVKTNACIRSIECGYALSAAFLPGNRHVVIGTKTGELEIFDINASSMIESIAAHEGAVWSITIRPDRKGLATGSADKDVKFWDFDVAEDEAENGVRRRLTLVHMRTLKMSDDVLCVRYSPNQNLIAISLLDTTIKVFYHDTLKFFLSLYGHKLPVLSMDISSDNNLLVSCSADKNVKLWGLDFGDCHKSIFAHQDSIMSVQFVWGTHYFFTAGKDKLVKYWDGDRFENIMKLEGHHSEVWAIAIAKHGNFVVSSSHDRSIRIWEKTEEQLFLEEEREKELEELYDSTLANSMEKANIEDGEDVEEMASAGKQTMETLKAGERIMEAIEIADEEKAQWRVYEESLAKGERIPPPPPNPHLVAMGNLTPDQYVLRTVEKVRSSDLDEALLVLPFKQVISLFSYLDTWSEKNWNLPLTCRILFFLLKVHHHQIVSNRIMRPMMDSLRKHLRAGLQKQKDNIGYNTAALKYVRRDWEANNTADFFDEEKIEEAKGEVKKRKFVGLSAA